MREKEILEGLQLVKKTIYNIKPLTISDVDNRSKMLESIKESEVMIKETIKFGGFNGLVKAALASTQPLNMFENGTKN